MVNITDVDDKLIVQAQKDGTTVKELAERVTRDYLDCLAALGVDGIDHMPRATEHIGEIIAINQALIDKGFAYESGGRRLLRRRPRRPSTASSATAIPRSCWPVPDRAVALEAASRRLRPLEAARSPASRRGTAPGGPAGRAGTSNARP